MVDGKKKVRLVVGGMGRRKALEWKDWWETLKGLHWFLVEVFD